MPYVERRGHSIRVKWWAGEYLPNGKKKYESASGPQPGIPFQDDDEAYDFGLDREYDVRHGTHVRQRDGNTPMKVYIWDWFQDQDLRPTSTRRYKSMLNARIEPHWGEHTVGGITAFEYQAWKRQLDTLVKAGKLAENYAGDLAKLFGTLMSDAVEPYRLRKSSPVVVKKRRGRYAKKTAEKKRPLEMSVLYQLACNAYTVWGYTGWVYMWHSAFTCMRPGESFGLTRDLTSPNWPAADPDRDRRLEGVERYGGTKPMHALRVQYQHQCIEGTHQLTGPKYDSHRTLVVAPFLHGMYGALLASHASPWTFTSMKGLPLLDTHFVQDYWYPIRGGSDERVPHHGHPARARIPAVPEMDGKRIYLLRHHGKAWLDEDGHCEVAVESFLGHEVAGLRGLYGNFTPTMERRIARMQQQRWEGFWKKQPQLWRPPFPTPLPVDQIAPSSPQVADQIAGPRR